MAADDMAATLAYMVNEPPVNGVIELAGPESLPIAEFVGRYARATDFVRGPSSRRWCQPRRAHSPHSGSAHGRRPPRILRRSLRTLAESHAANRALRAMYPGLIGDLTRRLSTMHVGLAETSARNIPYVGMTSVGCPPEAGVENQPPRACHLLRYAGGVRAPGWCLSHDWSAGQYYSTGGLARRFGR